MNDSDNVTILLGRKPIDVPRPVIFKYEPTIETVECDPPFAPPRYRNVVTAHSFQLFSRGKLFATSSRFTLKKEIDTDKTTLRLFKNRTTLY